MKEQVFVLCDRKLSALCSGEPGDIPLLALHGWLDNAESFAPLSQHLPGYHLVALDLAGHGRSDHRSADGEYNIWNDLPDILAVVDALGWQRFHLLGHSRGAAIASLFASACADRVQSLVLLDAYLGQAADPAKVASQLNNYMQDKQRLFNKPSRLFADPQQAISLRAGKGVGPVAAERLVKRNLVASDGGWRWSTDPRLQGASAFKLTAAHNAAIMSGLTMPTLILLAEQGLSSPAAVLPDFAANIVIETVPGGHHCHMEESVPEIAQRIGLFIGSTL